MKIYKAYLDDGKNLYKVFRPSDSKKSFIEQYGGNGEIIKIEDVTEDFPISLQKVYDALSIAHFGEVEKDIIISCLQSKLNNCIE